MNEFIFDLDGMIVNTQTPFHAAAEAAILKKYCSIKIDPKDISERFAGLPTKKVFSELAPDFNPNILEARKWKEIYHLAGKNQIECLPGMYELISILWKFNNPIAIASASPMSWIETCLKKAQPWKSFQTAEKTDRSYRRKEVERSLAELFGKMIVSAENCENPKPAPDVFLKAQALLKSFYVNEQAGKTFVVGDGRSDVLGGIAAGMSVLYLSKDNTEFDSNPKVRRFEYSDELSKFIVRNLI